MSGTSKTPANIADELEQTKAALERARMEAREAREYYANAKIKREKRQAERKRQRAIVAQLKRDRPELFNE